MNRRRAYAVALAATALVSGVGAARPAPSPTPTPTPSPTASQSDGTLHILTYRGYAEYGGVSPKVNWVGTFEKETGCRIARLDAVQTAEEMESRLGQRPYDLVTAGPALAGRLIEAKQVQPIDPAKVGDYKSLDERFRDMTTVSGKSYGVPYLWAYHEFVHDSSKVRGGGVAQVFASDRAALKDSPLTIADAALAEGSAKEPYELSEAELGEVMTLLGRNRERVYWRNPVDLVKGFATGRLDYAQVTPYHRLLLQKAGLPIETVPARRTTGWLDSWMLGANVADTTCAYRWINWVTAADAQRDAAAWTGMAPANAKACKGRAREMCRTYGMGEDKRLDRVEFAVRPPGDCRAEDGECTDYATWTKRWHELVK
ncbi:extracellular solute-binding protein [Nonomuraea candida]|uniref:extracellular solute-binding protein n=1 Tax=Nonomuraea candida TaxID=359159 RepID=UPI0014705A14|nr:extracellular solute-binding protein [Nonomuraea candida]